jgi:hypothetical protein
MANKRKYWADCTPDERAEAEDKMPVIVDKALIRLFDAVPFLAAALLKIQFRRIRDKWLDNRRNETMCADRFMRVYWHPVVYFNWSIDEIMGVLIHEIKHICHEHFKRQKWRDPDCWNLAADMEINQDIIADGFTLPSNLVNCADFQTKPGDIAERYYEGMIIPPGYYNRFEMPMWHGDKGCFPQKKQDHIWKIGDKVELPDGDQGIVIGVDGPDNDQKVTVIKPEQLEEMADG